jgi:putative ABC transport system permease protein
VIGSLRHPFALAARHLLFHRVRSALIILALALMLFLPIAVRSLARAGTEAMITRARATPLVVGARGSELDLAVAAMYFARPTPRAFAYGEAERVASSTRAATVPLHLGFTAQRAPLVGTTIDYFESRRMTIAEGRLFGLLGECVIGATLARREGLAAGGMILTDAADPFSLAGTIPLRLRVVGVLAPSGGADDDALFVDLKTAWTVAGIGHGHQEADAIADPDDLLGRVGDHVVASERLRHFEEITPESAASFHFHWDIAEFPIHAILLWPRDEKEATLLRGAFQRASEPLQVIRPTEAIERLVREILRFRQLLDAILLSVGVVTIGVVGLVLWLSVRLREEEIRTMIRLGASRATILRMLGAELLLLGVCAAALTGGALAATVPLAPMVERALVQRSN